MAGERDNLNPDDSCSDTESAVHNKSSKNEDEQPINCVKCEKKIHSEVAYLAHLKKHDPPGGYCCRYCTDKFCYAIELRRHLESAHTTIACGICSNVTFSNEYDYREHIKNVHHGMTRAIHNCEKCGAVYQTMEAFTRHQETNCGTIRPFKCEHCEKTFFTKIILKHHVQECHTGEFRFCCSYCGKSFRRKCKMLAHERIHTGEKPYKCEVCGKAFGHRSSLVTHSSLHTGIRLVVCKCCGSRFSCSSNLIRHRRSRPDTCGKPEFDAPKQPVRKCISLIPALLNPTQEIKVNKIIKPDDEEKVQALKKEKKEKSKIRRKTKSKLKTKKKKTISDEEELESTSSDEDKLAIETVERKQRPKRQVKKIIKETMFEKVLDTKQEENFIDDEHFNNNGALSDDGDDEYCPPNSKDTNAINNHVDIKEENTDKDNTEDFEQLNAFVCSPINHVQINLKVEKSEDDLQILDTEIEDVVVPMDPHDIKVEITNNLHETEVILLKTEKSTNEILEQENDTLDINCMTTTEDDLSKCFVALEDVLQTYPELKKGQVTVKAKRRKAASRKKVTVKKVTVKEVKISRSKAKAKEISENKVEDAKIKIEDEIKEEESKADVKEEAKANEYNAVVDSDDDVYANDDDRDADYVIDPDAAEENNEDNAIKKKRKRKPKQSRSPKPEGEKKPTRKGKKSENALKTPFKCPDCVKLYYSRKRYTTHLKQDHKKTNEELEEIFKDDDYNGKGAFKCHICDKLYIMEKHLLDHIPIHGADGKLLYKCPCRCEIYFASIEETKSHAQEAHREQLWCQLCEKFMQTPSSLKAHKAIMHGEGFRSKEKKFFCDKCGWKFESITRLSDHVRSDCGRSPIYKCDVCGKSMSTASILKIHMRTHQDETPYKCETCGKTFKIKHLYRRHIKYTHSTENPFKCHLCPKEYPYRESLVTHMSVHTGIKRFMCNGCGKRFTCISNLQAHRRSQANTCGLLPLNTKATHYVGVQNGVAVTGAKPEPGFDFVASQTVVVKEALPQDIPPALPPQVTAQDFPYSHSAPQQNVATHSRNNYSSVPDINGGIPLSYATNNMFLFYMDRLNN